MNWHTLFTTKKYGGGCFYVGGLDQQKSSGKESGGRIFVVRSTIIQIIDGNNITIARLNRRTTMPFLYRRRWYQDGRGWDHICRSTINFSVSQGCRQHWATAVCNWMYFCFEIFNHWTIYLFDQKDTKYLSANPTWCLWTPLIFLFFILFLLHLDN